LYGRGKTSKGLKKRQEGDIQEGPKEKGQRTILDRGRPKGQPPKRISRKTIVRMQGRKRVRPEKVFAGLEEKRKITR